MVEGCWCCSISINTEIRSVYVGGQFNLVGTHSNAGYAFFSGGTLTASASPTSKNFGSQEVGTSAAQTITFSNTGTEPITVGTINLTGSSEFQLSSDSCSGQTLVLSSSCTVTASFAPTSTGLADATINIPSDAANGPGTVPLSGTGFVTPPPTTPTTTTTPTATDENTTSGTSSGSSSSSGTTTAPSGGTTASSPIEVKDFRFSPSKFFPTEEATGTGSSKKRSGSSIRYTVNQLGTFAITFKKVGVSLKQFKNCERVPFSQAVAMIARCRMVLLPSTVRWGAQAGEGQYRFNGWISKRKLRGKYRVTGSFTNRNGETTAVPSTTVTVL